MTELSPGQGHNLPDFQKTEIARLAVDYVDLGNAVTEILQRADAEVPAEVTDDAGLAIVNRYVVDMRDLSGRAIKHHDVEKMPHLRRGQGVDQFFFGFRDRLKKAMDAFGERGNAYNRKKLAAERERLEAEAREAARVAREAQENLERERSAAREAEEAAARARKPENARAHLAEADRHHAAAAGAREAASSAVADAVEASAAAAAKPAEITRRRTDDGYLSTMREKSFVQIVDASKLDKGLLWPFLKEDAILAALKAYAKTTNHKRPMDGAIIEMRADTEWR